jgi:hypothetical protein
VSEEYVKALNGKFISPGDLIEMYAEAERVVVH